MRRRLCTRRMIGDHVKPDRIYQLPGPSTSRGLLGIRSISKRAANTAGSNGTVCEGTSTVTGTLPISAPLTYNCLV
jgi:hypothetical protein